MSDTFTIPAGKSALLRPGYYWLEVETLRGIERAELLSALKSIGFSEVRFEHVEQPIVSAASRFAGAYAQTKAAMSAAAKAAPVAVKTTTAPSVAATKASSAAATVAPLKQAATATPGGYAAQKAIADAEKMWQSVDRPAAPPPPRELGKGAATVAPKPSAGPQGPGLGKGAAAVERPKAAPAPQPVAEPAYEQPVEEQGYYPYGGTQVDGEPVAWQQSASFDPTQAGHDYIPPAGVSDDATAPAPLPIPESRLDSVVAVSPRAFGPVEVSEQCKLLNPGSVTPMYVCAPNTPGGARIAGRAPPPPAPRRVVRFTATLVAPVELSSTDDVRWKAVHRLAFNPALSQAETPGGVSFQTTAFPLEQGKAYDLRLLSRDKTARSKEAVLMLLERMGFQPATAMLMARNMRVPKRPTTSMSEWLAHGVWRAPDSLVTSDDPFYFVEARPST